MLCALGQADVALMLGALAASPEHRGKGIHALPVLMCEGLSKQRKRTQR